MAGAKIIIGCGLVTLGIWWICIEWRKRGYQDTLLEWFNHIYLQQKSNNELAIEFREVARAHGFHHDIVNLEKLVSLVKQRVSFVKDIWRETDYFFIRPETYDQEAIRKRWKPDTPGQLIELKSILDNIEEFTPEVCETAVKAWIEKKGYDTGTIMNALRLVVVGELRGPRVFDIVTWIGKEETLQRIDKGVAVIGKLAG